ncbi:MAG: 7TM domain-containing protein [Patescibacteria group bacterium]
MLKRIVLSSFLFACLLFFGLNSTKAQAVTEIDLVARPATRAADLISQKQEPTEPFDKPTKGRLEAALDSQQIGPLSVTNFLRHAIRKAISQGAPTNTIVLLLLLPFVGVLVSGLYYLLGLTGFGLFMPAMISVAFLATGVVGGLVLFAIVLMLTMLSTRLLKKVKLHARSRRAITLWVTSLGTFGLLLLSPSLHLFDLNKISIFPILFIIILSEEFIRTQTGKSRRTAISLTLGTIFISILGALLMDWSRFQELVLLYPEASFLVVLIASLIIGRYSGLRLLEYRRFKAVLRN